MTDKYQALREAIDTAAKNDPDEPVLESYVALATFYRLFTTETAASLLSDLDAANARADDLSAKLDAMTNQAVMLSGRRSTIVDASDADEVAKLRAALEKAERERDEARGMFAEACKSLRDAQHTAAVVREREDANGGAAQIVADVAYEMRQHWPDTAPSCLAEKVGDVVRELSARRASEAECLDTISGLRASVAESRAEVATLTDRLATVEHVRAEERAAWMDEVKRLREMVPSDDERDAIECAILDDADSFERKCVREWLTRLDAARGGSDE